MIRDIDGATYLVIASTVQLETMPYALYTAYDISDVYATREQDLAAARTTGLVCGAAISAAMLVMVLIFLHPLKVSVQTIEAVANGNYSLRVPEHGSAELRTLARSINNMSASIDEREQKLREIADSRKRFADSMAHEMKTPLGVIRGYSELMQERLDPGKHPAYLAGIVGETERMDAMVLQILSFPGLTRGICRCAPFALPLTRSSASSLRISSPASKKAAHSLSGGSRIPLCDGG